MKRSDLLSIGEVSKLFHISVNSLRHYENIGLLSPEYVSPDSGYRYYGPRQFEVLNNIRYLRALDMPLGEIQDFICNRDIHQIEEKLLQQKEIVLQKQQALKRIEQKIDHRLARLQDAQTAPLDTISLVQLPPCRLVWMENSLKIGGFLDMETPIRQLDQSTEEPVVFLGKVGLGISVQHLQQGQTEVYDGIFLILDQEDLYSGKTLALPETRCVRLRFRGSHTEAQAPYQRLLAYIREQGLKISGFSREITLIDYGFTNDTEKFVTEICIPVEGASK